jgi:hypothetical protein
MGAPVKQEMWKRNSMHKNGVGSSQEKQRIVQTMKKAKAYSSSRTPRRDSTSAPRGEATKPSRPVVLLQFSLPGKLTSGRENPTSKQPNSLE